MPSTRRPGPLPSDPDGHLGARQELLDEHRTAVARAAAGSFAAASANRLGHRAVADALARALVVGLDEHRDSASVGEPASSSAASTSTARATGTSGDTTRRANALSSVSGERQRVRAGEGQPSSSQTAAGIALAAAPARALRDVEGEVEAALVEPPRQATIGGDALDADPERPRGPGRSPRASRRGRIPRRRRPAARGASRRAAGCAGARLSPGAALRARARPGALDVAPEPLDSGFGPTRGQPLGEEDLDDQRARRRVEAGAAGPGNPHDLVAVARSAGGRAPPPRRWRPKTARA